VRLCLFVFEFEFVFAERERERQHFVSWLILFLIFWKWMKLNEFLKWLVAVNEWFCFFCYASLIFILIIFTIANCWFIYCLFPPLSELCFNVYCCLSSPPFLFCAQILFIPSYFFYFFVCIYALERVSESNRHKQSQGEITSNQIVMDCGYFISNSNELL